MIFDQAKNLDTYRNLGIEGRYAKAIDWLKNTDLKGLAVGRYEIDGSNVYALIQEYETLDWENGKFETHDVYTDIQYVIDGDEVLGYARRDEMEPKGEYNAEKDMTFYAEPAVTLRFLTHADEFLIFFPQDGHMPKTAAGQKSQVKKCVIKIKETK